MRSAPLIAVALAMPVWGQFEHIDLETHGPCAPAVVTDEGNVQITCEGVDPRALEALEQQLSEIAKEVMAGQAREDMKDQLMRRNFELQDLNRQLQAKANDWAQTFQELIRRLDEQEDDSEVAQEAEELIKAGELEDAGRALDKLIERQEASIRRLARNHFNRGRVFDLQFQPLKALSHFEKAFNYQPDVIDYAFTYASFLHQQHRLPEAEALYGVTLRRLDESIAHSASNMFARASVQNNLANIFTVTRRATEAAEAYAQALSNYRQLSDSDPDRYSQAVAHTLNNVANLYRDTRSMGQAENAYYEALSIFRELARTDYVTYGPSLAMTLNNLANLFGRTHQMECAEGAYQEALSHYRRLAQASGAYLSYVGMTLNNLANLYIGAGRIEQAERTYTEALSFYRQLPNRSLDHLLGMAMVLDNLGNTYVITGRMREARNVYLEALSLNRQLAAKGVVRSSPSVAMTLNNLAGVYRQMGRLGRAQRAYRDALSIFRYLARSNPNTYLPHTARMLYGLAFVLRETGEVEQAERHTDESLDILRELQSRSRPGLGDDLAKTLALKAILSADRAPEDACQYARESTTAALSREVKRVAQAVAQDHCAP